MKKVVNWESAQYGVLVLTVLGQILIGWNYFVGQGVWLLANGITVLRNAKLDRPHGDKNYGYFMFALTLGLIVLNAM